MDQMELHNMDAAELTTKQKMELEIQSRMK
jgi:hypothetical protein